MKSKVIKKIIMIGVIVIMGILALGALSFKQINEEKSFAIEDINEIQVNMTSEPIRIIRTEASDEVKFHYYGKSMQALELKSETNNKTLIVGVKREHLRPEVMHVEIYIPKDYEKNLLISSLSGTVKMDAFDLESFTYTNLSGKLETEEINADSISMNTSSGKLNIKKVDTKELTVESLSGAINIDECIANEVRIVTKSGSITLALPSTAEFLLEAKTSSGKIQSEFPISTAENTDKKKIAGQVGTKNNKVFLGTLSGSIKILKK